MNGLLFPFLLVFLELPIYLSNDMYLPALPRMQHDLHTTSAWAQSTLTFWFIGSALFQLIMGILADRYGRRPTLLIGGFIFMFATLLCATAHSIHVLLIARLIQGATVCSVLVAGYASIHESYSQTKAVQILALMGSITILAPAFGPLVGSFILMVFSWRWIFWMLTVWVAVMLCLLFKYMPETLTPENVQPIAFKPIFSGYKKIATNLKFNQYVSIFCFLFASMIAWIVAGPFLVISAFKKPAIVFGIYQAMVFGMFILFNHYVRMAAEKIVIDKLINIGLFITFMGTVVGVASTHLFPHFLFGLIFSLMILTSGAALAFAPANRLAIEASTEPMGIRMAIFSMYMSVFGGLGSVLVSLVYHGRLKNLADLNFVLIFFAILIYFGLSELSSQGFPRLKLRK